MAVGKLIQLLGGSEWLQRHSELLYAIQYSFYGVAKAFLLAVVKLIQFLIGCC